MPSHLKALEQVEREDIPGLVEVLREEGLDAVRYVLWEATAWLRAYTIRLEESGHRRAKEEGLGDGGEDREGPMHGPPRDLHEAHERQVEETMETLAEGPEGFYKTPY